MNRGHPYWRAKRWESRERRDLKIARAYGMGAVAALLLGWWGAVAFFSAVASMALFAAKVSARFARDCREEASR